MLNLLRFFIVELKHGLSISGSNVQDNVRITVLSQVFGTFENGPFHPHNEGLNSIKTKDS